jgi:hypothetical protein
VQNQEEGKILGPLTTLKRMETILRELNMDHLKFHIISEPGKKMEGNGVSEPNGAREDKISVVVFHVHQRNDIRVKL